MKPAEEQRLVARWIASEQAPAREAAEAALAKNPGDAGALCLAALAQLSAGDREAAGARLKQAAALKPPSALALALRGLLLEGPGTAEGEASLSRAVRLRPAFAWPLALRAQLRRAAGDLPGCLKDLDAALAKGNEAWMRRLRAECLEKMGRMQEALADTDAALKQEPKSPALHALRGHLLFRRKDYGAAAAALTRGLALSPRGISLLRLRADCRSLQGDSAGAAADLKRCVALEPASRDHTLSLARLLVAAGGKAGELAAARLSRSGDPHEAAEGRRLRGRLEFRRGRYAAAAKSFSLAGRAQGDPGMEELARGFEFMKKHRRAVREDQKKSVLVLAGLGLDAPYQASLETLKVLSECDIIVNNCAGADTMEFLRLFCKDVRAISFEGFEAVRWADQVFKWLKPGLKVAFVTRGHPLVSGHLALELVERARERGVELRCYGALSSVDQMLALTQEILCETYWGLQVFDSQLLLASKVVLQNSVPALIYISMRPDEKERARKVGELCATLAAAFGAGHEVMLFGPRYDTRELERCRVSALKTRLMSVEPAMLSSLILLAPPLEKAMLRQAEPGRRPRL